MDEGYLQTKISENKIKLEEMEKQLFDCNRKLSLLERSIKDSEENISKIQSNVKSTLETFNFADIQKQIKSTVSSVIEKKTKEFLDNVQTVSKNSENRYKTIVFNQTKDILRKTEDGAIKYVSMVWKTLGEALMEFDNILLNKKITKEHMNNLIILHQNYVADDVIHEINFDDGVIKTKTGKGIVKKWSEHGRITQDKRKRVHKVKIHPKLANGKVLHIDK